MADFGQQVAAHVAKYKRRLRATARTAVQDTVEMAQLPRAKGGRLRVDTGFLRASIQAGLGQMPSGPTTNEGNETYAEGQQVAGEPVSVTLLRWNMQDTLFVGWTANYARAREAQDGFLRGAVELWDQTVDAAAKKVRTQGL
jgi:hypothetical protein